MEASIFLLTIVAIFYGFYFYLSHQEKKAKEKMKSQKD